MLSKATMDNTVGDGGPNARSCKRSARATKAATERRNAYAVEHYGLVEKVARRLSRRLPSHVSVDDLVSAGMIGLLEASERFDSGRNDRFEAFAEFRIRGAMLDELRLRDSLSRDMRRVCKELAGATNELANQLGRLPTDIEVAERMGVSVVEIRKRQSKLSGQSVVGFDDLDPGLLERTADDRAPNPCETAVKRELFEQLADQVGALPQRQQQVLALYYCEDLNLREIAAVLGVTESRICQIHTEATKRLRASLGDKFAAEIATS